MEPHLVFDILVREHAAMLDVFLRGAVHDPGRRDDVFQETVVQAWRNLEKFDRTRPFGPWLRGIAGRLVLAQARKDPRMLALDSEEALAELEGRCDGFQQIPGDDFEERLERLRTCIAALDARQRAAIDARYEEGLRGGALAGRLATSLENARKLVQRARRRLAECLDSRERASEVSR